MRLTGAALVAVFVLACLLCFYFLAQPVFARDLSGEYKDSPLHQWFDKLTNSKGWLCCSFADGVMVEPDDIDTDGNHWKVRIDGKWVLVPTDALVTVPNKFGRPIVWPYKDYKGETQIRCFLPGAGI